MKPDLDTALHLLHGCSSGTLATHSQQLAGYPFATVLPFALDERHCPTFLVSGLAEHTKNLLADHRASFLVVSGDEPNVLTGARMTVVGDAMRTDVSPEMQARFLRYQPEAQTYLELGDFAFFRMVPRRARYIGGFAQMGWIEDSEWENASVLPLLDEAVLIHDLLADTPPGVRLLGLDCYGIDVERKGKRERQRFPSVLANVDQISASVRRLLAAL